MQSMLKSAKYIVPFVGFTEEPYLLLFKYIPVCLEHVLFHKTKTHLSSSAVVKIAKDIACVMRDIHANNIVHLDLKPGKQSIQVIKQSQRFN